MTYRVMKIEIRCRASRMGRCVGAVCLAEAALGVTQELKLEDAERHW